MRITMDEAARAAKASDRLFPAPSFSGLCNRAHCHLSGIIVAYAIGGLGTFWTIQRIVGMLRLGA